MTNNVSDIDKLSFEKALLELEKIVADLEKGEVNLEDSITSYERGVLLKKHCEKKLKDAETRITKISVDDDKITQENSKKD